MPPEPEVEDVGSLPPARVVTGSLDLGPLSFDGAAPVPPAVEALGDPVIELAVERVLPVVAAVVLDVRDAVRPPPDVDDEDVRDPEPPDVVRDPLLVLVVDFGLGAAGGCVLGGLPAPNAQPSTLPAFGWYEPAPVVLYTQSPPGDACQYDQ